MERSAVGFQLWNEVKGSLLRRGGKESSSYRSSVVSGAEGAWEGLGMQHGARNPILCEARGSRRD